jgi:beta-lactamase regulating signal transducer with metallopeptidase domain
MTHPAVPLSPVVVQSLGWALLHVVWQGAALTAALSLLMPWCRRASTRYALGVGALVLLVAAPIITFLLLLPRPRPSMARSAMPSGAAAVEWVQATLATAPASPAAPGRPLQSDRLIWLVELWFAGVALFSLRATGGILLIERLKRRGVRPVSSELLKICQMLQRRLGIDRAVRFCETRLVAAPAVIGLFRPVVLLPVTALTGLSEAQLEAIIAHELAHIRRLDSFVNLFQVGAESLLFYHPAVWWVSRRIRAERENCCDDEAIRACGDAVGYARALTLLEERRSAPVLAMGITSTPLAARVLRLLGLQEIRGGLRGAGLGMSVLCLAGALIAGNGFWGVAKASFGMPAPAKPSAPIHHPSAVAARRELITLPILANGQPAGSPAQASSREPAPEPQNAENSSNDRQDKGFIEQMSDAGLKDLTVDQLIALKLQGVTPAYVRQMLALGLTLNADELIQMRVQGVTPEYVKEMRATGLKLSAEQLVGMRVQGVTPEYVREMHDLGFEPDADALVGMRVQGVKPEFVKEMRVTGLKLTAEQLVGMKVQGVTPEHVREMHDLGFQPDADALVGMRVQGVTPEYVKEMRATGLKLTGEQVLAMRVQGVTPEYVKALAATGLRNLASEDYIAAKIQGITPEFVEKARQHGFRNLSVDKLIQLKFAGVL